VHRDVVGLEGIGDRDERSCPGLDQHRLVVEHPVGDVGDALLAEQVGCLVRLGQSRALPAAWRSAGEALDGGDRVADRLALVVEPVHRDLHEAVAHELPPRGKRRLGDPRIGVADIAVDRERRGDAELAQHLEQPPEADPHAVLVPGPVGQVRQQRLTHRGWQHCTGHRPLDGPLLDVDDRPHREAGAIGQGQLRPIDDRRIGYALTRLHRCLPGALRSPRRTVFAAIVRANDTCGQAHFAPRTAGQRYTPARVPGGRADPPGRQARSSRRRDHG
jgi:hypothetical protein